MPRAAWTGLFEVLKLVNDWLKFAEAKNAGIIGIASAALAVLLTYVTGLDRPAFPLPAGVPFAIDVVGLGASICIGLVLFNAWVPRDPSHGETRCPAGICDSII